MALLNERCSICGKRFFFERDRDEHVCDPVYHVLNVGYIAGEEPTEDEWEDASRVRARHVEEAVEGWAQQHDSNGDYEIVGGSEATVWVREPGGAVAKWRVSGRQEVVYTAHSVAA